MGRSMTAFFRVMASNGKTEVFVVFLAIYGSALCIVMMFSKVSIAFLQHYSRQWYNFI